MRWLKHIAVDLLATLVIAIVVFFDETALLEYVLYIYTGLMVIARLISLLNTDFRAITKRKISEAPTWMYHVLYFLNVAFLIIGGFYITGTAWAFIWGVAYYVYRKNNP
ncbi:MAG: hypothetical protein EA359_14195 [Balneolaceae bacterium]|nr:MAG: hypothetical protein EA359_14195 [Balneolaceae bacterium]